ncbi:MsnO8 family LLM class oxidoreductase [Pseudonocardia nantongensis]|uniref:MsnO8 family LLM class oxidoreductase n=1 Tax=Pseudonocardia nantongensis TaxID=1181885 RepID=UPI0039787746
MPDRVEPQQLAIHDTSPVVEGSTAAESLQRSVELARVGDRLGFGRYWAAELHGMRAVAGCAPAVLAGIVASRTTRIRVGAGGVLLPHHSPLVVSEQFGTLEALHPGRIDLALGRGAGGPKAARAVVSGDRDESLPAFSAQVDRLCAYFRSEAVETVRSTPGFGNEPQLWLLGGSAGSARLAAEKRLPYAFGGFYNRDPTAPAAVEDYRGPAGREGWSPRLGIWVGVIAADTADEAEYVAGPHRLKAVSKKVWGRTIRLPSAAAAAEYRATGPDETAAYHRATEGYVIGDGADVRRRLAELRESTGADELIVRTPASDHAARLRSFRLLVGDDR